MPETSPVHTLSFVRRRIRRTGGRNSPARFWLIRACDVSGERDLDELLGRKLALEYLEWEAANPDRKDVLAKIIADMPAVRGPVEKGFMKTLEAATRAS